MLHTRSLHLSNFDDFVKVMEANRVSKDCFCLSHRVLPENMDTGFPARQRMQQMVAANLVNGVLVYAHGEPQAWLGVEPAPLLLGHDVIRDLGESSFASTLLKQEVWVVHCMVTVPHSQQRKELLGLGMQAAIEHARVQGAKQIVGFPLVASKYAAVSFSHRFPGSEALFEALGFRKIAEMNNHYALWIKDLNKKSTPQLSLVK